jgi:opacity protein-like surface antigen
MCRYATIEVASASARIGVGVTALGDIVVYGGARVAARGLTADLDEETYTKVAVSA